MLEISYREFFFTLFEANKARNMFWDPKNQLDKVFFALEHVGEAGELANMVKKLHREELGLPGSRVTREQILEELGDDLITLSLLCISLGVSAAELVQATTEKFNKTSTKVGLPIYMGLNPVKEAD